MSEQYRCTYPGCTKNSTECYTTRCIEHQGKPIWKESIDGNCLYAILGAGVDIELRVHKTDFWWGVFQRQYRRAGGDASSLEKAQSKAVEAAELIIKLVELEKAPQKRVFKESIEMIRRAIHCRYVLTDGSKIPENARVEIIGTDLVFVWEE